MLQHNMFMIINKQVFNVRDACIQYFCSECFMNIIDAVVLKLDSKKCLAMSSYHAGVNTGHSITLLRESNILCTTSILVTAHVL